MIDINDTRVILASASPRRQELLRLIFDSFKVMPADVDEKVPEDLRITEAPRYLAELKCNHIAQSEADALVIGSDTGVFTDGEMLGKPHDAQEAFEMLKRLSGRTHDVITGCCVVYMGIKKSFSCITKVKFKELTDKEIKEYIDSKEPLDKAGAYGIQGKGALFIEWINGDYYTVMGLPVNRLYCCVLEILDELNVN